LFQEAAAPGQREAAREQRERNEPINQDGKIFSSVLT
jgi:hypothetical protein